MTARGADTQELLIRWHGGDGAALHALLERHLPWVRAQVHRRLGPRLRVRAESEEFVHEALVDFLTYSPRFVAASGAQFRQLLARVVENAIRDQDDYHRAWRRRASVEEPLSEELVVDLRVRPDGHTPPDVAVAREEELARLRLALELLEPPDRRVLLLRTFEGRGFEDIGRLLGLSDEAARKRHERALRALARAVELLRQGELP